MKKRIVNLILTFMMTIASIFGCFACGKVEFKVNFVVDGAVYAVINTNGREVIKMPKNPIKEEYAFDGWYWDENTWQTPFTVNSLLDAPLSSNMSVYCKWKANNVRVESVVLDKAKITLVKNDEAFLVAAVLPKDATNQSIVWESSDVSVATVIDGKITGVNCGKAVITVIAADGNKTATCEVAVVDVDDGWTTWH